MINLVFLEYTFLLNTAEGFHHLYEFEKTFADYLATRGLQGVNIKSVEGSLAKRVMYITKRDDALQTQKPMGVTVVNEEVKHIGRPQTLKGRIRELSDRKLRAPAMKFIKGK
jgi:hypothetical protein